MAGFIIATVTITNPEAFGRYAATIAGLAEKYGGEQVFKGGVLEVLEGNSPRNERIVVTRFPDTDAARAYLNDPVYKIGKQQRLGAAHVQIRLCED